MFRPKCADISAAFKTPAMKGTRNDTKQLLFPQSVHRSCKIEPNEQAKCQKWFSGEAQYTVVMTPDPADEYSRAEEACWAWLDQILIFGATARFKTNQFYLRCYFCLMTVRRGLSQAFFAVLCYFRKLQDSPGVDTIKSYDFVSRSFIKDVRAAENSAAHLERARRTKKKKKT